MDKNLHAGHRQRVKDRAISEGLDGFCRDGLIYRGAIYSKKFENGKTCYFYAKGGEEEIWNLSKKRIVFLCKDTNANPGEDYRYWGFRSGTGELTSRFFKTIAITLFGLFDYNERITPYEVANRRENYIKAIDEFPFAIVNCKKESGGSAINNFQLNDYLSKYHQFLKRVLL